VAVLPLPTTWPVKFGISIGDYGAVVCKNCLVFGVFADRGPAEKLGEASLMLLRKLGQERLKNGHIINAGLNGHAITIVFPGSGAPADRADEATLLAVIATKGKQLFDQLGGDKWRRRRDRLSQPWPREIDVRSSCADPRPTS
jgi:hypothetical protein